MKLSSAEIASRMTKLPGWAVAKESRLTREFSFPDFAAALAFVNRVGQLAEERNHHPDVYLTWGKVRLEIWTHSAGGITEADFGLAAACDQAL